jgi:uncharacterized protein YndB with AHSA1/START domain
MDTMPTRSSTSIEIAATPDRIFATLTDLVVLPTFSPENQRCELLEGWSSVEVGARFRGYNKAGDYEWHADCEITVFEPGREFAYVVPPDFEHATTWRYTIEPTGDDANPSCLVTESFDAPLLALPDIYPGTIEGRHANLERACATTLANLKAALDARTAS